MILGIHTLVTVSFMAFATLFSVSANADGYCGPLGSSPSFMENNKDKATTLLDIREHQNKKEFRRILFSLINKFGAPPVVPDRLVFHKLNTGQTTVSVHANGCTMAWFVLDKASVNELLGDPA